MSKPFGVWERAKIFLLFCHFLPIEEGALFRLEGSNFAADGQEPGSGTETILPALERRTADPADVFMLNEPVVLQSAVVGNPE